MTRLLSGELLKLRTTRTAIGFAVAAIVLVLLVVLLSILAGDPRNVPDKRDAVNFGGTTAFVLLIFGVVGATGEYRHRTLAPSLLVAPDRARLTVARMVAYGITGLLIGLLMLVVAFGIGLPLLAGQPGPDLASSDLLETGGGGVLSVALSAMLGVGIGVLVRNQVAAVVGTLVWFFIVEPLLTLVSDEAYKFSISQSASAVAGTQGSDVPLLRGRRPRPGGLGGAVRRRRRPRRRPPRRDLARGRLEGQPDVERRALRARVEAERPAVALLDDPARGVEAQAGALADLLRGEERLEDAVARPRPGSPARRRRCRRATHVAVPRACGS